MQRQTLGARLSTNNISSLSSLTSSTKGKSQITKSLSNICNNTIPSQIKKNQSMRYLLQIQGQIQQQQLSKQRQKEQINSISAYTRILNNIFQKGQKQLNFNLPYDIILDTKIGKYFLKTDYNKIKFYKKYNGKINQMSQYNFKWKYRSPYTNCLFPQSSELSQEQQQINEGQLLPSRALRQLQQKGNLLFGQYTKMYYGFGINDSLSEIMMMKQNSEENNSKSKDNFAIGNFFASDNQDGSTFVFVCKKSFKDQKSNLIGGWDSTNIIEIRGDRSKNVTYKLQTSVVYQMKKIIEQSSKNKFHIFGFLKKNRVDTKKLTQESQIDQFHLSVAGKMIQQTQTIIIQQITSIFLSKTKDILFKVRQQNSIEYQINKRNMAREVNKLKPDKYKGQVMILNK